MEILRKKEFEEDRLFQNFHEMILYHMRQMQQCLTTAGKMFCDHNDEEETCEKRGRDVVESVILKECVGCCENQKCQFTLADKDRLGQIIEKQGGLSYADLKRCHPCKNGQDFIEEANQIYERELFLRAMRNQMKQLRKIVGEQYIRAGNTLGDFFQGKVSLTADNKKLYEKITKGFAKSQLRLKEIYFYDNPEKGKQIYLYLKKKKGREISTRQAAVLLSSMTMEKMKPLPDQKKMIGNYYEIYGFTPEEKFHVIAGIHTLPMIAGDENGDSFSMGKVREGSFVSMISDGMGTGQEAKKESRKIIEVMEELLGAGINESQSIQLLSDAIHSFNEHCLSGLKANQTEMEKNLHNSLMLVTCLNPVIGYEKAGKASQYAYKNDLTLKQAILELGYLSEKEFDLYVDPKKMINE